MYQGSSQPENHHTKARQITLLLLLALPLGEEEEGR